jgi:hypothetical protein
MFRSNYDGDITTWSPQGRIHQIEYAMEAVKQGSACVGLKSKTHAVIVALKRSSSELGSYQKKIFKIDDHIGIAISGLTGMSYFELEFAKQFCINMHLDNFVYLSFLADARVLSKYMRTECLNHKFVYEEPVQTSRLVIQVADSKPFIIDIFQCNFRITSTYPKIRKKTLRCWLVSSWIRRTFLFIAYNLISLANWCSFIRDFAIRQLL